MLIIDTYITFIILAPPFEKGDFVVFFGFLPAMQNGTVASKSFRPTTRLSDMTLIIIMYYLRECMI